MSEQVDEGKTVGEGTRVRIISYCAEVSEDNGYVGLTGHVSEIYFRHNQLYVLVKLDNDPNPTLAAMLGGLPCLAHEVEVIDGNPASN